MQFLFSKIFHVFIPNKLRIFPRPFTHGGICPPTSAGELMRGDIDLMGGGGLTLIDYIIN